MNKFSRLGFFWLFLSVFLSFSLSAYALDPCASDQRHPQSVITLQGEKIFKLSDLHDQLEASGLMPSYYGRNLDALYDVLLNFEGPLSIVWLNSKISRQQLGEEDFQRALSAMTDAQAELPVGAICLYFDLP